MRGGVAFDQGAWHNRLVRHAKLLELILEGMSDANIPFVGIRAIVRSLGFHERIKGDHHIFYRDGLKEILNLQPRGAKAKPYQVKQVRNLIIKYKLGGTDEEQI
jgi:hypothetical protein